jgi:hypothetical protein
MVDQPTFVSQKHVRAAVAVAHAVAHIIFDAQFQIRLSGATRFVVIGRSLDQKHRAGPPDRNIPLAPHHVDQLALPERLHSFRRSASCNISLSSDRSAITFRSLALSSSSCLNRRISVGYKPSYFRLQLKYVAWLIAALRQNPRPASHPCPVSK